MHACEVAAYRQVDEQIELLVEIVAWRCIQTSVADVHTIIRFGSVVEIHVDDFGSPLQYELVELAVLQARRRGSELAIVGIATILINTPVAGTAIVFLLSAVLDSIDMSHLQNVDFTARRPCSRVAKKPEGWPQTVGCLRNHDACFQLTIFERHLVLGEESGRSKIRLGCDDESLGGSVGSETHGGVGLRIVFQLPVAKSLVIVSSLKVPGSFVY